MLRIARDVYFLLITTTAFACSGGSFLGSAGKNRGTLAVKKNSAEASAFGSTDLSTPCYEALTSLIPYYESDVGDSEFIVKGLEFANMQTLVTDLANWYQQEAEDTTLRDIQSEDYDPDIVLENLSTYSLSYDGLDSSPDEVSLRMWDPTKKPVAVNQVQAQQVQQHQQDDFQIAGALGAGNALWQQQVQAGAAKRALDEAAQMGQQKKPKPSGVLPEDYYW